MIKLPSLILVVVTLIVIIPFEKKFTEVAVTNCKSASLNCSLVDSQATILKGDQEF